MFETNTNDLAIVVPTRGREDSLSRLVRSVQENAPDIPVHVIRHPSDDYDHPNVTMWESDTFPIGGLYKAIVDQVDAAAYLFLDDDHSLTSAFDAEELRAAWESYGAWSLPVQENEEQREIRDASKCGGQLVRADVYNDANGHGRDFLEDIELSLRLSWAGTPPKRYPQKMTVHHQGISGGYRTLHPQIDDYPSAEATHSRLAERYDRVVKSDSSWYGYRESR